MPMCGDRGANLATEQASCQAGNMNTQAETEKQGMEEEKRLAPSVTVL